MGEPEHIAGPLKRIVRVIEVYCFGDNYDLAVEAELQRLGLKEDQVQTIICIPCKMAERDDCQLKLFDETDAEKRQR